MINRTVQRPHADPARRGMIAKSVVCRLGPPGGKDTVYVQQALALGQRMLPDAQMEARVTRVLRMSRCRSGTQI